MKIFKSCGRRPWATGDATKRLSHMHGQWPWAAFKILKTRSLKDNKKNSVCMYIQNHLWIKFFVGYVLQNIKKCGRRPRSTIDPAKCRNCWNMRPKAAIIKKYVLCAAEGRDIIMKKYVLCAAEGRESTRGRRPRRASTPAKPASNQ